MTDAHNPMVVTVQIGDETIKVEVEHHQHHHHHHPHHERPRLHAFTIVSRKRRMSGATASGITYLNAVTTTETVQALDQYGNPYLGADLVNTTVATSNPANVGATLGAFDLTTGRATLTLTQAGGEGSSAVTIVNGAVSLALSVLSYVPVLTSFVISAPPAPPAPVVTPTPVAPVDPAPTPVSPDPAPAADPTSGS